LPILLKYAQTALALNWADEGI